MPTRKPFQREHDLQEVSDLYLQGWSQHRIAQKLNAERDYDLTQQTISNDLREIQKRWQANTTLPLEEHKVKELARIDKLEAHYWDEYLASKEPRKISAKSAKSRPGKPDARGNPTSQVEQTGSERIEQREGNPAFLQGVERCIKLRCDLLGLNAPVKEDKTVRFIDMDAVKAEMRRKIEAGQMTRQQALQVTDNDYSLVDELFKGIAIRVSVGEDI